MENSLTYYQRRRQHALALAKDATDADIRAIHTEMAAMYERMIVALAERRFGLDGDDERHGEER